MKDGNNSVKDELTQRLEEELKKRGIARKYLTDEEVESIIKKGRKDITDIFNKMIENVEQRVDRLRNVGKTNSSRISRELRRTVKERIIQGTSFEDLAKDKDLKITEAQMERLKKEFAVIFLLVQGMPKMDIARKVLSQEEGEDEQTYNLRLEQAVKTYRMTESINKITEIRKTKEAEITARLNRGETVEEIVADNELNVCEEFVRHVIRKIEKSRTKEEIARKIEQAEAKRKAQEEAKAKREAEAAAKKEARAKRKAEAAAKKEADAKRKAKVAPKQAEYKRRAEKGATKKTTKRQEKSQDIKNLVQ